MPGFSLDPQELKSVINVLVDDIDLDIIEDVVEEVELDIIEDLVEDEDTENGSSISRSTECSDIGEVMFSPSLCYQRYQIVLSIISEMSPPASSVIDLGCNNCRFLSHLKELPEMELVAGLDIDSNLLCQVIDSGHLRPLPSDYINGSSARFKDLNLEIWTGSAVDVECAKVMEGVEVVTCVEMVEHLNKDSLDLLPESIFGSLKPRLAVITTPNYDFNSLFPDWEPGNFRHWDHKFEWTREEFIIWTEQVVTNYPEYNVEITGVGHFTDCEESHGPASQVAVFRRQNEEDKRPTLRRGSVIDSWMLVDSYRFPGRVDERSRIEKLRDELIYYLRLLAWDQRQETEEEDMVTVRLEQLVLFSGVSDITTNLEEMGVILMSLGYLVDMDKKEVKVETDTVDESSDDDSVGNESELYELQTEEIADEVWE